MSQIYCIPSAKAIDYTREYCMSQTTDSAGIDAPAGQETWKARADQHPCKERSEDHICPPFCRYPQGEDQLFFAAIHRRELFPILGKLSFKCLANDQILKETAD